VDKTSVFGLRFDGVEEKTSGNFGWRKDVYDHKSFLSNVTVSLFLQTLKIKTRTRRITLSLFTVFPTKFDNSPLFLSSTFTSPLFLTLTLPSSTKLPSFLIMEC